MKEPAVGMESSFDKHFCVALKDGGFLYLIKPDEVKEFIRAELASQRQEIIKEIKKLQEEPQVKAGDADPWCVLEDLLTSLTQKKV